MKTPDIPSAAERGSVCARRFSTRGRRGSVLIIVMVTMLFAVAALTLFMEKASTDLIVETRDATDARLRGEAYSALETTLAVLVDFREALGGLRNPSEGWDDPLGFAGYQPEEDREVEISFEDESGKVSLPAATPEMLVNVFKYWELSQNDSERLADALLGWMRKEHVPMSVASPTAMDYDRGDLPYVPPQRSLRSFAELASIEYAREVFFDEKGNPTDLYGRFTQTFSLYTFRQPNLNSAPPDLLAVYGGDDPQVRERLGDFLQGRGMYQANGAGVFKSEADIAGVLGAQSPAAGRVGTQISALRVIVTVREGMNTYRLSTLVALTNGVRAPEAGELNRENNREAGNSNAGAASAGNAPRSTRNTTVKSLNYPFTLLEIRENGAIPDRDQTDTSSI